MAEVSRVSVRLDSEMESQLNQINNWAEANGMHGYNSRTGVFKLALELVTEFFVVPYEKDVTNDYAVMRGKYLKNDGTALNRIQQQLQVMLSNQELELILATNQLGMDDGLTSSEKIANLDSYLKTNSEQSKVLEKVSLISKENTTIRVKGLKEN
ncbi:hypothetical protein [Weissella minor]|uniref:hypothetical protein n=1 Tax=Weissella minor TaxID=1620 RepID=UPI003AF28BF3